MDLAVWSARPFKLPAELPKPNAWKRTGKEFAYSQKGWHVLVLLSDEDEPDENIVEKLSGAAHVAYVTLEPIGADKVVINCWRRSFEDWPAKAVAFGLILMESPICTTKAISKFSESVSPVPSPGAP